MLRKDEDKTIFQIYVWILFEWWTQIDPNYRKVLFCILISFFYLFFFFKKKNYD
jgi:hypothetical protein